MSFFRTIKEDYRAHGLNFRRLMSSIVCISNFWLVFGYRVSHMCFRKRIPLASGIIHRLGVILFAADICPSAVIGPGFRVPHSVGVVIGGDVIAGRNFEVFQNVTIGGRNREFRGRKMPMIGENVSVFTGAAVLGPVMIGRNVSVGANSVVLDDIPPDCVAVGIPARVVATVETPHSLLSIENATRAKS